MCSTCPCNVCDMYGMWSGGLSVCVVCVDGVRACVGVWEYSVCVAV